MTTRMVYRGYLSLLILSFLPSLSTTQSRCQQVLRGSYDYIIVGGGSTGSVIAARLSEDKDVTVLLLEAGSSDTDIFESHVIDTPGLAPSLIGSDVDWKYTTVPQKHCCSGLVDNKVLISRGKVLGGTSAIDDMTNMRGSRHVFDLWEEMGSTGWNHSAVLPYFVKSEDFLSSAAENSTMRGHCGPIPVQIQKTNQRYEVISAGINELGWPNITCNDDEEIGLCRTQTTTKNGERVSTAKAYLRKAQDRNNMDILTDATVYKINIDKEKRVNSVTFKFEGEEYTIDVRREVIVSAGAIGSAKLLLLSGLGPRTHLKRLNISVIDDLPVGENLQDGYMIPIRIYLNIPSQRPDKAIENVQKWRDYIYLRQGDLAQSQTEAHIQLRTLPSKMTKYPDLQVSISNMLPDYDHDLLKRLNVHDYIINEWYSKGLGRDGVLAYLGILHPKSRGRVLLNATNPTAAPLIDPLYLLVPDDVEDMLKGVRFIQALLETPSMKAVNAVMDVEFSGCSYLEFNSDDYWRCYIQNLGFSTNTPTGTVRMGRLDDVSAVVDPSLRVKGVSGLRVADSSIMPETTGFTRPTEIMIGEKLADILKEEIRKSKGDNKEQKGQSAGHQVPQVNRDMAAENTSPQTSQKPDGATHSSTHKETGTNTKEIQSQDVVPVVSTESVPNGPVQSTPTDTMVSDMPSAAELDPFLLGQDPFLDLMSDFTNNSRDVFPRDPVSSHSGFQETSSQTKTASNKAGAKEELLAQAADPFLDITPEQKNQDIVSLLEQLLITEVSKHDQEPISSLEKALVETKPKSKQRTGKKKSAKINENSLSTGQNITDVNVKAKSGNVGMLDTASSSQTPESLNVNPEMALGFSGPRSIQSQTDFNNVATQVPKEVSKIDRVSFQNVGTEKQVQNINTVKEGSDIFKTEPGLASLKSGVASTSTGRQNKNELPTSRISSISSSIKESSSNSVHSINSDAASMSDILSEQPLRPLSPSSTRTEKPFKSETQSLNEQTAQPLVSMGNIPQGDVQPSNGRGVSKSPLASIAEITTQNESPIATNVNQQTDKSSSLQDILKSSETGSSSTFSSFEPVSSSDPGLSTGLNGGNAQATSTSNQTPPGQQSVQSAFNTIPILDPFQLDSSSFPVSGFLTGSSIEGLPINPNANQVLPMNTIPSAVQGIDAMEAAPSPQSPQSVGTTGSVASVNALRQIGNAASPQEPLPPPPPTPFDFDQTGINIGGGNPPFLNAMNFDPLSGLQSASRMTSQAVGGVPQQNLNNIPGINTAPSSLLSQSSAGAVSQSARAQNFANNFASMVGSSSTTSRQNLNANRGTAVDPLNNFINSLGSPQSGGGLPSPNTFPQNTNAASNSVSTVQNTASSGFPNAAGNGDPLSDFFNSLGSSPTSVGASQSVPAQNPSKNQNGVFNPLETGSSFIPQNTATAGTSSAVGNLDPLNEFFNSLGSSANTNSQVAANSLLQNRNPERRIRPQMPSQTNTGVTPFEASSLGQLGDFLNSVRGTQPGSNQRLRASSSSISRNRSPSPAAQANLPSPASSTSGGPGDPLSDFFASLTGAQSRPNVIPQRASNKIPSNQNTAPGSLMPGASSLTQGNRQSSVSSNPGRPADPLNDFFNSLTNSQSQTNTIPQRGLNANSQNHNLATGFMPQTSRASANAGGPIDPLGNLFQELTSNHAGSNIGSQTGSNIPSGNFFAPARAMAIEPPTTMKQIKNSVGTQSSPNGSTTANPNSLHSQHPSVRQNRKPQTQNNHTQHSSRGQQPLNNQHKPKNNQQQPPNNQQQPLNNQQPLPNNQQAPQNNQQQPPNNQQQPPNNQKQPRNNQHQPPNNQQQPPNNQQQPPNNQQQPPNNQHRNNQQQPLNNQRQPPKNQQQPQNNKQQPPNNKQQPPNNQQQPLNNQQPLPNNQQQPQNNQQQPPNNQQQPPNNQQQPINNQQQPRNNQQQPKNNQQQPRNNQQQPQHNQQQPLNNQQQLPNNQQQPPNNQQPLPNNQQQPQNNKHQPPNNQQQPINTQQQPRNNQQQPKNTQQQRRNNQQQPPNNQQQPPNNQQQPRNIQQQPQNSQHQPRNNQQQPRNNQQPPPNNQLQPFNNQQHQPNNQQPIPNNQQAPQNNQHRNNQQQLLSNQHQPPNNQQQALNNHQQPLNNQQHPIKNQQQRPNNQQLPPNKQQQPPNNQQPPPNNQQPPPSNQHWNTQQQPQNIQQQPHNNKAIPSIINTANVNHRSSPLGIEPPMNNKLFPTSVTSGNTNPATSTANQLPQGGNSPTNTPQSQSVTQNIGNPNEQFFSKSMSSDTSFFLPDSGMNFGGFEISNEVSSNLFIPDSNTNSNNLVQNNPNVNQPNTNSFLPPQIHSNFPQGNAIQPNQGFQGSSNIPIMRPQNPRRLQWMFP